MEDFYDIAKGDPAFDNRQRSTRVVPFGRENEIAA